ncbi:MAG: Mrp/NBP35 family ATP-binding protein [Kiritimatiellia bacterium]
MSEDCTHDCSTCGKDCGERKEGFDFTARLNAASKVGKVIAVASGKGGVGKSFVTAMLAVAATKRGLRVGILDADITGPSIPKAFGLAGGTVQGEDGIEAKVTTSGIRVMSLNMLVEDPSDPVVWRGPVIAGAVKQFWTDVHWGELDVMFVDMPPGTGDVPLTVFQSLPVDGVVVVTTPQDLVEMIVAKSVKMAQLMHKPVLGLVENMSCLTCPDCGRTIDVFGASKAASLAGKFGIPETVRLPINPAFSSAIDGGAAETIELPAFEAFADRILK